MAERIEVSKEQRGSRLPALSGNWGALESLHGEFNRMVDQLFHRDPFAHFGLPTRLKGFDWSPTVDVAERPECYEITAELPGTDEKDVSVTVDDGVLTITGEKKAERKEDTKNLHFSERHYGAFQRSFGLPDDADEDKISADFNKGVLKVTVARSKKPKKNGRQISIKAA